MIELIRTLLSITWPLLITSCALRALKNSRPDRDLVLPTPYMILVLARAQLNTNVSEYLLTAGLVAICVLLHGCQQQKRNLARWATIACGAIGLYVQAEAAWLAHSSAEPPSLQSTRL